MNLAAGPESIVLKRRPVIWLWPFLLLAGIGWPYLIYWIYQLLVSGATVTVDGIPDDPFATLPLTIIFILMLLAIFVRTMAIVFDGIGVGRSRIVITSVGLEVYNVYGRLKHAPAWTQVTAPFELRRRRMSRWIYGSICWPQLGYSSTRHFDLAVGMCYGNLSPSQLLAKLNVERANNKPLDMLL